MGRSLDIDSTVVDFIGDFARARGVLARPAIGNSDDVQVYLRANTKCSVCREIMSRSGVVWGEW